MKMSPLFVLTLTLAGCPKPIPIEEFSLVLEASEDWEPRECEHHDARVDLIEIKLPEYLMSRSFMVQHGSNAITVARHHFWAEPLDAAVHKVLVQDISALLPSYDITSSSGRFADCTMIVDFDRLHASSNSQMLISGRYTMTSKNNNNDVVHREFNVSLPLRSDDAGHPVTVMRRSLAQLSEQMATVVQQCRTIEEDDHHSENSNHDH